MLPRSWIRWLHPEARQCEQLSSPDVPPTIAQAAVNRYLDHSFQNQQAEDVIDAVQMLSSIHSSMEGLLQRILLKEYNNQQAPEVSAQVIMVRKS